MTLLEESAAEFTKARDENDRREAILPDLEAAGVDTGPLRAEVRETRLRIAEGVTILAAGGMVSMFCEMERAAGRLPVPSAPGSLSVAAGILMTAAQANVRREADTRNLNENHPEREKLRAEALQIADGLTRLAAISAGLPPCCCHAQPEQETT